MEKDGLTAEEIGLTKLMKQNDYMYETLIPSDSQLKLAEGILGDDHYDTWARPYVPQLHVDDLQAHSDVNSEAHLDNLINSINIDEITSDELSLVKELNEYFDNPEDCFLTTEHQSLVSDHLEGPDYDAFVAYWGEYFEPESGFNAGLFCGIFFGVIAAIIITWRLIACCRGNDFLSFKW